MTKPNSEYFELSIPEFSTEERFFQTESPEQYFSIADASKGKKQISQMTKIRAIQQTGDLSIDVPIHQSGTQGFFLHDSLYNFLKSLKMDELWDTYPVELYEKDGKTRIPNYHHGLIVKQHVGFVTPPWATPRTLDDSLYGSPGISPLKGTWFNEAELIDDRLFCINQGPPTFRRDIKEQIKKAFPIGIEWKNLKDT